MPQNRSDYLQRLGRNPMDPSAPPQQPNPTQWMLPEDKRELDRSNFGYGTQGPVPFNVQYPQGVTAPHRGAAQLASVSGTFPNVNPPETVPGPTFSPSQQAQIWSNLKYSGQGSMVPGSYAPVGGFAGSKGLIAPGNLDPFHRQALGNPGGGYSNTTSESFEIEHPNSPYLGKQVLVPTVVNGRRLTLDEAKQHFYRTGQHFGIFDSIYDAVNYSLWLHNEQTRRAGEAP